MDKDFIFDIAIAVFAGVLFGTLGPIIFEALP